MIDSGVSLRCLERTGEDESHPTKRVQEKIKEQAKYRFVQLSVTLFQVIHIVSVMMYEVEVDPKLCSSREWKIYGYLFRYVCILSSNEPLLKLVTEIGLLNFSSLLLLNDLHVDPTVSSLFMIKSMGRPRGVRIVSTGEKVRRIQKCLRRGVAGT